MNIFGAAEQRAPQHHHDVVRIDRTTGYIIPCILYHYLSFVVLDLLSFLNRVTLRNTYFLYMMIQRK